MAKKSMWAREAKRTKTVTRYAKKRAELKAIINDRSKSPEEVDAASARAGKILAGLDEAARGVQVAVCRKYSQIHSHYPIRFEVDQVP